MLTEYDVLQVQDAIIANLVCEHIEEWEFPVETHAVVRLPASAQTAYEMQSRGWTWGDRTLATTISLRRAPQSSKISSRLTISAELLDADEAFPMASAGFEGDRRFYVTAELSRSIGDAVLRQWLADVDEALTCRIGGVLAGFLQLVRHDDCAEIRLAATDEKWRRAGSALALYSVALQQAYDWGCKSVVGRISSRNVSVMNLYAHLGAKFSNPVDVFCKEVG
ncbi:MAG: GNAT family N-acetyltransferase [Atopobiaceae bacterium]|nr:GNAT family N-acetyltransferase [Atopobiaceae bacterium]